jgi:hypothetical protein
MWRCGDEKMWGYEDEKTRRFENGIWKYKIMKIFDRPLPFPKPFV